MSHPSDPTRGPLDCEAVRELAAPFVLDALEPAEADAVRAHLATCPEPHPEFLDLAGAVGILAETAPQVEPPASLGLRIRAAAAAEVTGQPAVPAEVTGQVAVPAEVSAIDPVGPTRQPTRRAPDGPPVDLAVVRRQRRPIASWATRIAAVLAIAVLGGWNLLLQGQIADAQRYERDVAAVLDVAARDGSLTAILTADGGGGPSGLAAVAADGTVTMAIRGLAPTTGNEVYEAWVIGDDGVPQPLGSFTADASGVASFRGDGLPAEPGVVLALTREPAPGATEPTLPIVTLGTATLRG